MKQKYFEYANHLMGHIFRTRTGCSDSTESSRRTSVMERPYRIAPLVFGIFLLIVFASLCGCTLFDSKANDFFGSIVGNEYTCSFYTNDGEEFMTMHGSKIDMSANIVREKTYSNSSWGYTETMSSVVTITIDGSEVENCGTTAIFAQSGLEPDVDFSVADIESSSSSLSDSTAVAGIVNKYKNLFGKKRVVVIQSQLGNPICAYSGDEVYWELSQELPKTTKLLVDGKALYIHRANFQIIDTELLS